MGRTLPELKVRHPPDRPTLVYDGRCLFCLCHVERWKRRTGDAVDYIASDAPEPGKRFPEIPAARFNQSLHFIDSDGSVYAGAHGALRALAKGGGRGWRLKLYEKSRLFAALMEFGYRRIAANRGLLSRVSPCARRLKR